MRKQKKYRGVIIPMLTPVLSSGKIDEESVQRMLDYFLQNDSFLFILGTTGEIASNSYENRERYVKITANCLDRRSTLYAGISDNCIYHSIEASKKYADLGVDVCVAHLPIFFPLTPDLMLTHFETLADNSPVPIIIYNIQSITHMTIPIEIIEKLSYHTNIVGLKDSSRDWERVEKLIALFKERDDFSLFIGWTAKSAEALLSGFDGIVPNPGNVTPAIFQALYKAAVNGEKEKASKLQEKVNTLIELVQKNKTMTRTVPELKVLMNHLNICKPYVLPPLKVLGDEDSKLLVQEFKKLNFLLEE